MPFRLIIPRSFKKRLDKKIPALRGAVMECVERLAGNPTHPGLRCRHIRGAPGEWEARVDSKNRISWMYGGPGEIVLLNHCTHEEVLP